MVGCEFSKNYLGLFSELASNFSVYFFLTGKQVSKNMVRICLLFLTHSDRSISFNAINIWNSLYYALKKNFLELCPEQRHFFSETFYEAMKVLFERCRLPSYACLQKMSQRRLQGRRNVMRDGEGGDVCPEMNDPRNVLGEVDF